MYYTSKFSAGSYPWYHQIREKDIISFSSDSDNVCTIRIYSIESRSLKNFRKITKNHFLKTLFYKIFESNSVSIQK